jgi:diacylglycerol kinase (ATP)
LSTAIIVNPASAGGRTARRWAAVAQRAADLGLDPDVRLTAGSCDATAFTRAALAAGATTVIAVGGDGTVSEVVNGFFADGAPLSPAAELVVAASGTGADVPRTFALPDGLAAAADLARSGDVRVVDVGRVRCAGRGGGEDTRLFLNVASAGMTGLVADRVNRSPKRLGGTVAFAWGTVATFVGHRNSRFVVEADGERRDLVANNVIVANCRYFAGGMHIAPGAAPDDGLFDVLVIGDISKVDLARNMHKLYRGTHIGHPRVEVLRARRVRVEPETPLPIEADGELPGLTPAEFEVVPRALRLRVPAARPAD